MIPKIDRRKYYKKVKSAKEGIIFFNLKSFALYYNTNDIVTKNRKYIKVKQPCTITKKADSLFETASS